MKNGTKNIFFIVLCLLLSALILIVNADFKNKFDLNSTTARFFNIPPVINVSTYTPYFTSLTTQIVTAPPFLSEHERDLTLQIQSLTKYATLAVTDWANSIRETEHAQNILALTLTKPAQATIDFEATYRGSVDQTSTKNPPSTVSIRFVPVPTAK